MFFVVGQSASCSYQAPQAYDSWTSRHLPYDNIFLPSYPVMAYDNVPRNLLFYDNAPPPGKIAAIKGNNFYL